MYEGPVSCAIARLVSSAQRALGLQRRTAVVGPVVAYSVHVEGPTPGVGPKLLSPNQTIDHGHVTRHIERMHARNLRFPVGDYFLDLDFSIGLRVQLQDAIDRHSIPIAFGAVLSGPIKLSVALENPPRWPGRAHIALYRVVTMRSPGSQGGVGVKQVEFVVSPYCAVDENGCKQPPPSKQERRGRIERCQAREKNAFQSPTRRKIHATIQLDLM